MRRVKWYAVIVLSFLALVCEIANGANKLPQTYFISPSGSDSNPGTSASLPFKSIAKLSSFKFYPGDKILFQGKETFMGNLEVNGSGDTKTMIEISTYGDGKAVIDAGIGTGIYIHNQANIVIKNLLITGKWNADTQSGNSGTGILFFNDKVRTTKLGRLQVSGCEVMGFKNGGIHIWAQPADGSQSGYSQITIGSNIVHDNGKFGIATNGAVAYAGSAQYAFEKVMMSYNKVYNNLGIKEETSTHTGDGLVVGDAARGIIAHNTAYHNGWYNNSNTGGPCGIWCYDATHLLFEYNESYENGTAPGKADGDGFDLDGGVTNSIMQYNYSHDNYAAGYLIWEYGNTRCINTNNVVRFNISYNDNTNNRFYGGITIGADDSKRVGSNLIYHNTIFSEKNTCVRVTGGTYTSFYNNIFYAAETGAPVITADVNTCQFLGNDYYNPGGLMLNISSISYFSMQEFRADGYETLNGKAYGSSVNPNFKNEDALEYAIKGSERAFNAFSLNQNSPLVNAAISINNLGLSLGKYSFNGIALTGKDQLHVGACQ